MEKYKIKFPLYFYLLLWYYMLEVFIMTKEQCKQYYDEVIAKLEEQTHPDDLVTFKERFANVTEVYKFENNYIYIVLKDALSKLLIEKFSSRKMNEILESIVGTKMGFKFLTEEEANKEKEKETVNSYINTVDPLAMERSNRKLRAEFTFDNFVVGDSNKFAYINSMQVAETPYPIYNPLYLFGDVGLGKTHLMMAICHYILDKDINTNVVYTSSQQFTEDFFVYTKKDTANIDYFYNKYRQADVLLVDDIQLLENKPATQEEFFKVFDHLLEKQKQIVVTSDRKASDLKLMARLTSRFNGGMVIDIKAPDDKLRLNILRRKLAYLIPNPNDVPDECLELIANLFKNNIRELEGALRRFVTWCISFGLSFTKENALAALEDIAPKSTPFQDETDKNISKVKNIVSTYFQISEEELISNSRKPNLVYARNLCFYIIRNKFDVSYKKIGESFGGKDYTSIMHGYEKIKSVIDTETKTKSDVSYIENKLN